ncbi:unnamed protein product [Soboliphyme baturini]|uniref:Protein kinase domain-containing protein n=1 Tax=Soboliphyme baturini TaxID=241478 RepID=A0A183IHN1_9BILA|nr:unnamed protein product [Soboliphyme baturini]
MQREVNRGDHGDRWTRNASSRSPFANLHRPPNGLQTAEPEAMKDLGFSVGSQTGAYIRHPVGPSHGQWPSRVQCPLQHRRWSTAFGDGGNGIVAAAVKRRVAVAFIARHYAVPFRLAGRASFERARAAQGTEGESDQRNLDHILFMEVLAAPAAAVPLTLPRADVFVRLIYDLACD